MLRVVAVACLTIAPLVASATIYKVEMPDGTIMFTDSPPAGGKILEERETKPAPRGPSKGTPAPTSTSRTGTPVIPVLPSKSEIPPGSTVRPIPQNIDAANAEIAAAERELSVLRRKLEVGREPQPGERLGTAKGGSRLAPEYESRIGSLEREVALAEDRVKRAYEVRNALR